MSSRALSISVGLALLAAVSIGAPSGAGARRHGHAREQSGAIPAAVDVGSFGPGSWCWFGDPRAVRVLGRYDQTFVGWVDWQGRITIGAYDPHFGVIRTHVVGLLFHDDHSAPAIFVEPDNRLTVFWSGHNGPAMFFRSTLRPEDISAWGPMQRVRSNFEGPRGFTYPNPVLLPAESNKLYLFWRGSNWGPDFAIRTIDGRWSAAHHLVTAPGQRPYMKVASNGSDTIAMAFTNGHPRERITSLYYVTYRAGALWSASGRRIANLKNAPITPQQSDVIYDGQVTGVSSWVWDVAIDRGGHPVVVYATFPSAQDHVYWYARWNGQRWISHFMTFAGPTISPTTIEAEYSGGITLDHSDPSVVYLSRKVGAEFEIERWVTRDGGYTWSHTPVVRNPGTDDLRPIVPRGADGGPGGLLWIRGHYGSYTSYRTSIEFMK
jgi:putative BNR repeat neuraminidase